MEPEIKRAALKASAKLGIGLSCLAAVIGIRIVTATAPGVASGIKELERLEAQMAAEAAGAASDSGAAGIESEPAAGMRKEDSLGSRMSAILREDLPNSGSKPNQGDQLVSCDLSGRVHFMRADDCASRGGRSTVFSDDH